MHSLALRRHYIGFKSNSWTQLVHLLVFGLISSTRMLCMVSKEDIVMLIQRALVLLGSASNTITLERRKIALSTFNPKLQSLGNEKYETRKTSLFGPGFLEKASKRIETSKTLDKVSYTPSCPLPKKRARFDNNKRHFLFRGALMWYGNWKNQRQQPYTSYTKFQPSQLY